MAEIATIARPYAVALFESAKSPGASVSLTGWAALLDNLSAIAQLAEVKEFVQNPNVSNAVVVDVFLAALKSDVNQSVKNFMLTLAENNRVLLLPEMAAQFHVLKNKWEGSANADITSAYALTEGQLASLCTMLETKFGRKLNPTVTIDPSLIGGVRGMVGDEVLDTSVRAKLAQMQVTLTA